MKHASTLPAESSTDDTPANLRLFEQLYTILLPWIITRARRLSQGDRDLQDDLMQIGLQTVWELCTPAVTTLDIDMVRAHAYRAMLNFRRAERRAGLIRIEPIRARPQSARTVRYVSRQPARAATATHAHATKHRDRARDAHGALDTRQNRVATVQSRTQPVRPHVDTIQHAADAVRPRMDTHHTDQDTISTHLDTVQHHTHMTQTQLDSIRYRQDTVPLPLDHRQHDLETTHRQSDDVYHQVDDTNPHLDTVQTDPDIGQHHGPRTPRQLDAVRHHPAIIHDPLDTVQSSPDTTATQLDMT